VPCCDLCNPELLNRTRPAPPSRNSRKKGPTFGVVDNELKKAIINWREEIWSRDFGDSLFGPAAVLSNAAIESLSSFGPIERLIDLELALRGYWAWFGKYGDKLLIFLSSLHIGPKKPKPPKPRAARGSKRTAGTEEGDKNKTKLKQCRLSDVTPTPVNPTSRIVPPPSTPMRPPVYLYPHHPQPISSSPLLNPYSGLMTPSPHLYGQPPTPYIPSPYYYHPNTLQQPSNAPFYPYQYPRYPPGPST